MERQNTVVKPKLVIHCWFSLLKKNFVEKSNIFRSTWGVGIPSEIKFFFSLLLLLYQSSRALLIVLVPSNSIGVLSKRPTLREESYNCKSTKSGTYFLRAKGKKVAEKALFEGFEVEAKGAKFCWQKRRYDPKLNCNFKVRYNTTGAFTLFSNKGICNWNSLLFRPKLDGKSNIYFSILKWGQNIVCYFYGNGFPASRFVLRWEIMSAATFH